ncbi:MAG: hypothetical protein CSB44_09585 [Gammaproteobacteria bacterium]|nr:MAG: hypothetical protein CSB44_09585 [Gammaproteobacteria bacterium]
MLEFFMEPLTPDYMRQALLIGLFVSVPAAALSCLLVLKGWSLMGDAVSHAVLPGIVIAWMLGLPFSIGAFASGLLCAVATGYLSENSRLKEDTVMGIVFSSLFALGVFLFTQIETELHLDHVLFGDMLGVSWRDCLNTAALTLPVLVITLVLRRDLILYVFDPQHAGVVGLPTTRLHYLLLMMLSLLIVSAIKATGIILVIAVLIAPGAIAFLITHRIEHMLWVAMLVGALATTLGVFLSYYIDSAPAPTIVVIMTGVFLFVFLFSPRHGILMPSRGRGRINPAS